MKRATFRAFPAGTLRARALALCAITFLAGPAAAGPPPGHPEAHRVPQILGLPDDGAPLVHEGRVVQALPSNRFSYLLVESAGRRHWLAAPRVEVGPETRIRFPEGRLMRNFYSKVLERTFESVLFVSRVQVLQQGI